MASTLDTIAPGARVAIIRIRSLGDCVLTTPALDLLHRHRPDLTLGIVVEDRFRGVFENHPAVSEILPATVGAVRGFQPQMVINFHGGTRSTLMTAGSGARIRAGFSHYAGIQAYNLRIPRAQQILGEERPVHTAEHLASAMFYLGVPRTDIPRASLFASGAKNPEQGTYAIIHPFASAPDKAWPAEHFAELASKIALRAVILAGPQDDITPFKAFTVYQDESLDTVKRLLRDASLFIGNDSGPAHMAAAFGLPTVVLFGPSNPATWSPWKTEARVLQAQRPLPAASNKPGTSAASAPAASPSCACSSKDLQSISVDDCLNAVQELRAVRA